MRMMMKEIKKERRGRMEGEGKEDDDEGDKEGEVVEDGWEGV